MSQLVGGVLIWYKICMVMLCGFCLVLYSSCTFTIEFESHIYYKCALPTSFTRAFFYHSRRKHAWSVLRCFLFY